MQALFANGRVIIGIILAGLIGTGLSSCGSSTSNDQGVTFNLMGFFADFPDSSEGCTLPAGDLGQVMPLANVGEDGSLAQQGVLTIAGFQNALSGQFIRIDQASISYDIPGASQNPPSTSFPQSFLINPSAGNEEGGGSSLPPSYTGNGVSCAYASFFVVPADIQTWINFNRDSLPEAPFSMTAYVQFSGITSAGDRIDTNIATYRIYVSPDPVITEQPAAGAETTGDASATTDADSGVDSGSEEQL